MEREKRHRPPSGWGPAEARLPPPRPALTPGHLKPPLPPGSGLTTACFAFWARTPLPSLPGVPLPERQAVALAGQGCPRMQSCSPQSLRTMVPETGSPPRPTSARAPRQTTLKTSRDFAFSRKRTICIQASLSSHPQGSETSLTHRFPDNPSILSFILISPAPPRLLAPGISPPPSIPSTTGPRPKMPVPAHSPPSPKPTCRCGLSYLPLDPAESSFMGKRDR